MVSLPQSVPPVNIEDIDDEFIEDLIADARLYATYGRYAGLFKDERLFQTIATTLRERPISARLVVELQRILNETAQDIPFSTVAAMKAGWRPGRSPWLIKVMTLMLVVVSIILMLVVARLTLVHNEGTDLIAQAEELIDDRPQQTIDRLVREHVLARLQMEERAVDDPTGLPLNDSVSLALIESNEADLREITRRMTILRGEIGAYITDEAVFPLIGMQAVYCFTGRLINLNNPKYAVYCNAAETTVGAFTSKQLTAFGEKECPDALKPDDLKGENSLTRWRELLDGEKLSLSCKRIIENTDFRGAQFTKNVDQLRWHVGYFALWILPALYGAMGAVMYHMRWVLDPLLPHPSLLRLLHRVVLAALAGIVLGWFYAPGSAIEQAATTVGFSLFVLSFLFGFSLDVFFAMLDRLVAFSERSVRDVTRRSEGGPSPAFTRRSATQVRPGPAEPSQPKPGPPKAGPTQAPA